MHERNWAGNVTYSAARIHRPASIDELRRIIARAPRIRVLGSRHSFNTIGDSPELVSLRGLPSDLELDAGAATVTCSAATSYGELAPRLHARGWALQNLASLPQITVGGAIATATHGSGDRSGNLATQVSAIELVTSAGELLELRRGDADFDGLVVG